MEMIRLSIKKHPYCCVFLVWLVVFLTFGQFSIEGTVPVNHIAPVLAGIALIAAERLWNRRKNINNGKKENIFDLAVLAGIVYAEISVFVFLKVSYDEIIQGRSPNVPLFFALAAITIICIVITVKKTWSFKKAIVVLFFLSLTIHFYYMLYAAFYMQMDLGAFFTSGNGHIGYIEYLYNHFIPAQFDPREKWQYYHPPLHHYIEMIFLHIITFFGIDIRVAIYNMKYPPLLYFLFLLVTIYRFGKLIGLKKRGLTAAFAIAAFSPAFVLIGNYMNNDMLSTFLAVHSIYLSARWYKTQKISDIIKTALAFGAGMFTKLSVWMAAVPIAVIFVGALIDKLKNKNFSELKNKIGQMAVFLLVAAPLSFYWSVRNYVRFGVPFGYVPQSTIEPKYIDEPIIKRLFDFNPNQLEHVFLYDKTNGMPYFEYNPLTALLKTASVPLVTDDSFGNMFFKLDYIVFWTAAVLALIAFLCMIRMIFQNETSAPIWKTVMLSYCIVILVCYYTFCINYPDLCTEHIRYASPLILIGGYFIGLMIDWLSLKSNVLSKITKRVIVFCTVMFCTTSGISIILFGFR